MKKVLLLPFLLPILLTVYQKPLEVKDRLNTAAYHSTYLGKKLGRDLEFVTRPENARQYSLKKLVRIATIPNNLMFGLAGLPLRTVFTLLSHSIPGSVLRVIQLPVNPASSKTLTFMSFNTCLREGFFAQYTGGVVPPFEKVDGYTSRVEALADFVGKESPDIFIGQEFMDLASTDLFIRILKGYGYNSFVHDPTLGPISINSGLFVASKKAIRDVDMLCFPFQDKAELAKFARRGAVSFTVLDETNKPILRVYNTHLDAGPSQEIRSRQLKNFILPAITRETLPTILAGDLNFDTALYGKEAGLENWTNILEGMVTCNDEGKIRLRGAKTAIIEKIDGIIGFDPSLKFSRTKSMQVKSGSSILSDHFAVSTTVTFASGNGSLENDR